MIPSDERVPDYIINEEVIHAYRQTQNDWYEDGHAVSKFVHAFDRGYQVSPLPSVPFSFTASSQGFLIVYRV